ncbi:MAG: glycosyltransferase family 2 protein [Candidatus Saccharibacteria bacterium]|nr:glycosyltransferase family 2 protein [Candidatus Saccharibacteria bacterium]
MKRPMISVIVPIYNAEKYVEKCYAELMKQSFKDFEVIFVDDGSTDETVKKIKGLAEATGIKGMGGFSGFSDENVQLILQRNAGVSEARNKGITQANGKYLAFMDVDDYLEPNYLEALMKTAEEQHADAVMCSYYEEFPGRSVEHKMKWAGLKNERFIKGELIPYLIYPENEGEGTFASVWRILVRRDVIQKSQLVFDKRVAIAEDFLFMLRLLNRISSLYLLPKPLYHYVRRADSSLNKYKKDLLGQQIEYHDILTELLQQEGMYERNLMRYVRNRLRRYTALISNAVRCTNKEQEKKELQKIYELYKQEKFDYRKCGFSSALNLSFWLLGHKRLGTLAVIYRVKEKKRLKGLNQ